MPFKSHQFKRHLFVNSGEDAHFSHNETKTSVEDVAKCWKETKKGAPKGALKCYRINNLVVRSVQEAGGAALVVAAQLVVVGCSLLS